MPGVTTQTTRRLSERSPPEKAVEPAYYDISLLQAPVWKWEIAWYFFLGGISGGSYILGRLADRFGGGRYHDLSKWAHYVSLGALLPSPPLLIVDLGDPKRFHHMLRIFKPSTPMNLGTYLLTGHSATCTAEAVRQFTVNRMTTARRRQFEAGPVNKAITAANDVAGIPLAMGLAGYTGVLLSCSSTPLWSRNEWIGPLFSSSAAATAASAINLVLDLVGTDEGAPSKRALDKIETAAHVAEAVTLAGFLKKAGPLAKPMTAGGQRHNLWLTIFGIVGGELLKRAPVTGRSKRATNILASVVSLLGGFCLRWAFVYGGQESGNDPHSARLATRK